MKKRLLKNKKGDAMHHLYFIMFEVFMVIGVMWALLSYVDNFAENTLIEKSYLSKDLSLLMNTVYSAPGNLLYVYDTGENIDLKEFNFRFDNQKVTVTEVPKERRKALSIYYPYGEDTRISSDLKDISQKGAILLIRQGDIFSIMGPGVKPVQKLECPDIATSDKDWKNKKIVLDENNTKIYRNTLFDKKGYTLAFNPSNPLPAENRLSRINNRDTALLAAIRQSPLPGNTINALVSYESGSRIESVKLACLFLNNVLDTYPDSAVKITPVTPSAFSREYPEYLLSADKPSILIRYEKSAVDQSDIAKALHDAIKTYFK